MWISILADQSIYVSFSVFLNSHPSESCWIKAKKQTQSQWGAKLWHYTRVCSYVFPRRPPHLFLSLTSPPFSHHNIVFISPLRLNPSLPVRCGKCHFENEIGYINSSAITLAIAFPLYSPSETWLASTTTPTFLTKRKGKRQHMGLALSAESNWE